jgi:hypothetical protein
MVAVAGLARVQLAATPPETGVTLVTLAEAAPVLVAVSVSESVWPVLAVTGLPPTASVTTSDAGLCTATAAVAAVPFTAVPELASLPASVAPSVSDPVVLGVQVQVKVALPPPGTVWLTGLADVQLAVADPERVGVAAVARAAAWPLLLAVSVSVTACPVFTVARLAATLPLSAAAVWTVTFVPVTVGLMFAPLTESVAATVAP